MLLCCREQAAAEQTQSSQQATESQLPTNASDTLLHPLAEQTDASKEGQKANWPPDQMTGSHKDDAAGLSEELLDLFASIDHIWQEVEALQQPFKLPDAQTLDQATEQVRTIAVDIQRPLVWSY